MEFKDLISTAKTSLTRNKTRSILTILGIVIGIAAVILMLSIGHSAQGFILNQVSDLGSDLVFVEPSAGDPTSGPPDPFIDQTLKIEDAEAIERSGLFSAVSPQLVSSMTVSHEQESTFAQIVGITDGYLEIFPSSLKSGRFIAASDVNSYAHVAVLGKEIAEDLFGDQDPVGMKFKIKKTSMKVIGVLDEQGTRFFQNLDRQIAIPVTTMQRDILGVDYVSFISSRATLDVELAKDEVRYLMRDQHNIDNPNGDPNLDDFFVSSQSDAAEIIGAVGSVLTLLLSSIAAISLLVGGIGIMNIMLVSVTERTKEIGLRKSVGATKKEILYQFLAEAVMLTLLGGVIGIIFGILSSVATSFVTGLYLDQWRISIPVEGIVLGFLVASVVGIVFGIYPAKKGAELDPIEALRYE